MLSWAGRALLALNLLKKENSMNRRTRFMYIAAFCLVTGVALVASADVICVNRVTGAISVGPKCAKSATQIENRADLAVKDKPSAAPSGIRTPRKSFGLR